MSKKQEIADRLPPFSMEAEQGVLACMLLSPDSVCGELEELGVQARWFYDLRHQMLFQQLRDMYVNQRPIEMLTVVERLTAGDLLGKVGGMEYLMELPDKAASAANASYYARLLWGYHVRREMMRICTKQIGALYEGNEEVENLLAQFERDAARVGEEGAIQQERQAKDLLGPTIENLEHYHRGSPQVKGLTFGFDYLDKMVCGVGGTRNNMVVVSGRPGSGKTSFALDVMLHIALDYEWFTPKYPLKVDEEPEYESHRGLPVAIFSMEMTAESLVERMLFQRARADLQRFRTGLAFKDDFAKVTRASADIARASIWIDDTGRMSVEELKAKARRLKRTLGIRLFVVDYIQLMRVAGKRYREDRVQELAEISGELQKLGKELRTPFLILAQMNRDYEKDPNRTPRLADLKDCGAIEQDADIVGFLYSTKKMEDDEQFQKACEARYFHEGKMDWSACPHRVDMMVGKNRNGPTGGCKLLFFKACTHFADYVKWLKEGGQKDLSASERDAQMFPKEADNDD